MGDRGNCKFFAPNYFYPTKCQNCFKPKEQHSVQEAPASGKSNLGKTGSAYGGRNVTISKTLLKESVLSKARLPREKTKPETWERHWFALYSNGELQEYAIVDGQINKENVTSSVMLQDFIRMLDGKVELGEDLCFGIKTLRETIYFKTTAKVDYENWWKEISSFVASPLKRTASASSSKASLSGYNRPSLCKQLSVPLSSISPTRTSRSSSISSLQSDPENPQIEVLRSQVSKLEEENTKLLKGEEQRRKLELEVNYWKEYLTNAQLIKKSGGSTDTVTELADARRQLIQLQDELNQTQKRLKTNTGKLLMRNKEVADGKERLREANSIIAVYKAKIDQLTKELSMRPELSDCLPNKSDMKTAKEEKAEKVRAEVERIESSEILNNDARHLEDKFLLLKDRLKRIERELMIKSKELEKANESRSKVAKYTRSLLQELETRLSDNAQKLNETEEKLKNVNMELKMERERRIKLEESPRRRMSSLISPLRTICPTEESTCTDGAYNPASELTEHDADTKYADYYRSRFKEAESSLLEKDKKLHQAEEKIKEIQSSMKHSSDSFKIINDVQAKLSDATHKLSDRQLKIHELTCEVGRLKEFEKTYGKKTQQCGTLEDIVNDLEQRNSVLTTNLHQVKQELEMFKIREVVLKEQLQTFADDSEDSDSEDDKLGRSVDLKIKIEKMIDLESRCKKLTIDNEKLTNKNNEFETRLRHLNMQNFKSLESNKESSSGDVTNDQKDKRIKELEQSLSNEEDRFCSQLMTIKEQYLNEMSTLEKNHEKEIASSKKELEESKLEIVNLVANKSESDALIKEMNEKLSSLELQLKDYENTTHLEPEINETDKKEELENDMVRTELVDKTDDELDSNLKNDIELIVSEEKVENSPGSSSEEKDCVDTGSKDRDSGIVITQEIKNMIEAAKSNDIEIMSDDVICWESEIDSFSVPNDSVSETDIIEKYKMLCSKFQVKLKELSSKYVSSEEKLIELSRVLEVKESKEQSFISEYDTLLARIDELEMQIGESQEILQSKADELEKERKNVIHLVEVTSAYIKELEGSLEESKAKLSDLQTVKKSDSFVSKSVAKKSETIPEEPESDLTDNEEAKVIRQKLTAKIMTLESDISELIETHSEEIKALKGNYEQEMEVLKKQLSVDGISEDAEKLVLQVESLENELKEQSQSYAKEVELLSQHYQEELRRAYCGDNASIDMLSRMQELEMEAEQTRNECDAKIKEMETSHEQEKQQIKDDMATVLQASLSGGFNDSYEPSNSTVEELEERIIKLEQELIDMEQKYKDDLEMEKKAHQTEMEDTIRDMMMVRNATRRYSDDGEKDVPGELQNDSTIKVSSDEVEALKIAHTEEIERLKSEHDEEIAQIREDFTFVISSLKQGSSSDTIMELQGKMKDLELLMENMKKETKKEVDSYDIKIKRLESANFFAVRRNEEMGGKIYNMQVELEDMDRQHQMEIAAYQEKLRSVDGDDSNYVDEYIKENGELKEKNKALENDVEQLRTENESKMEKLIIKLQEEKRAEIEEMTDKVLKLESLIDEMKENHIQELKAFEKYNREERLEASAIEKERIKELECACSKLRNEYEDEITELAKEHKKEAEKLRAFYEKEIGDMKKRIGNEGDASNRKTSADQNSALKQTIKDLKERHEREVKDLKSKFLTEKEGMEMQNERAIEDMRIQYDEKLKMGYKEGLRRQSISERKSDNTRLKQTLREKEALSRKLNDLEMKYEKDTKDKSKTISYLQRELKTLRNASCKKIDVENIINASDGDNSANIQKKLKDIQEQIERYERRIEYYQEKSARDNTQECDRVLELQQEILELRKELNILTEVKRKPGELAKQELAAPVQLLARRTDGDKVPRRHTDNVTVKLGKKKEHDTRKRWSNLEETSEREDLKTGTVLARKTLWENISVSDDA